MDPYFSKGQAHGLAFSVKPGIQVPPSLKNIYKEIKSDVGTELPKHGCLMSWAKQGVLLLNSALTVRDGEPGSHIDLWKPFTRNIIKGLNEQTQPIVFMLWGAFARNKRILLTNEHHFVLTSSHPSPLGAYKGFMGCKHFSQANNFLESNNIEQINWKVT